MHNPGNEDGMKDLQTTPVGELKGVGKKTAERLRKLGIETALDLLFHLPLRYEDKTRVNTISQVEIGQHALVRGKVLGTTIQHGRRRTLAVGVWDGTATMQITFFHFNNEQKENIERSEHVSCYGQMRYGQQGKEMVHPEYKLLHKEWATPVSNSLTPVYPIVEGLGQRQARKLIGQALDAMRQNAAVSDLIPKEVTEENDLCPLEKALHTIHAPAPGTSITNLLHAEHPARTRLAFEEILAHHVAMRRLRERLDQRSGIAMPKGNNLARQMIAQMPFSLTKAQMKVAREIRDDMTKARPMHRLVQGDVGAGKTVVAALAACIAIGNGYQVALMAPTELLAEQHFRNFHGWFGALGVEVALLGGKLSARARERANTAMRSARAKVVVGTHALFQDKVGFGRLGLIIIDEQHRFGVEQRKELKNKGTQEKNEPHQMVMTATPIPRTLAMTAYADLDCSVIDELPPGRTPVTTAVITSERRETVIGRVREAAKSKAQTYWVCTTIEESSVLECEAAEETHEKLSGALEPLRVGLVHGRMSSQEKEDAMRKFKEGESDVLVATTVIEVGVDVPNATLMVIDNAERLGLAQLHQLRGRVGRGTRQSACVMLYQPPLGDRSFARLKVLQQTNDGFEIARKDLEIRGAGEVLGTKQTGIAEMRIADIVRDARLITTVEKVATHLMRDEPERCRELVKRWIGNATEYGYA